MPLKLLICCLFAFACAHGAYIGNPASPAVMNTGFFSYHNPLIKGTSGYIGDYTANKYYRADSKNLEFDPNDLFKKFIIHSQMASFSVTLLERLELFANLGGSKPRIKTTEETFDLNLLLDFQSSYQFAWSSGAKIILMQWGQTYFCTDFTYYQIPESPKSYFKFLNRLNLPIDFEKQELSVDEWQLSFALASKFAFLTPYFGGIYLNSDLFISKGNDVPSLKYSNEYKFGYFYGLTLSLTGRFHLNFEQRFRDEQAYSFSTIAVF